MSGGINHFNKRSVSMSLETNPRPIHGNKRTHSTSSGDLFSLTAKKPRVQSQFLSESTFLVYKDELQKHFARFLEACKEAKYASPTLQEIQHICEIDAPCIKAIMAKYKFVAEGIPQFFWTTLHQLQQANERKEEGWYIELYKEAFNQYITSRDGFLELSHALKILVEQTSLSGIDKALIGLCPLFPASVIEPHRVCMGDIFIRESFNLSYMIQDRNLLRSLYGSYIRVIWEPLGNYLAREISKEDPYPILPFFARVLAAADPETQTQFMSWFRGRPMLLSRLGNACAQAEFLPSLYPELEAILLESQNKK